MFDTDSTSLLMAERQILFDAINVGGTENTRLAQGSSPFGTLALQQMASPGAAEQYFAGAGYLETFRHGFFGFDAFGSAHRFNFRPKRAGNIETGLHRSKR